MLGILESVWYFLGQNAAVVISLCALVFTAYQVYATRKHNRLSVRPHISSFAARELTPEDGTVKITVSLRNHGLGPAVIKSYSALADGKVIATGADSAVTEGLKAMTKVFGDTLRGDPYVGHLASGDWMRKDESRDVLRVEYLGKPLKEMSRLSELNAVDARLGRFKFVVEYASVYGDKFVFDSERP